MNELGEDFVSYENEVGSFVLISEFGSNEYQCTGSCFCEEGVDRRGASTLLGFKGLFYLVAAVSSVIAINLAKEYYEDHCRKSFEGTTCPEHAIQSEVEYCGEIIYPRYLGRKKKQGYYEEKTTIYMCQGNCMTNLYAQGGPLKIDDEFLAAYGIELTEEKPLISPWGLESDSDQAVAKKFECEKLFVEAEIWIDVGMETTFEDEMTKDEIATLARSDFIDNFLDPFCFENSLHEFTDQKKPLCVGTNNWINPSIVCRELREKTLAYRKRYPPKVKYVKRKKIKKQNNNKYLEKTEK